jgi:hypothetical protein
MAPAAPCVSLCEAQTCTHRRKGVFEDAYIRRSTHVADTVVEAPFPRGLCSPQGGIYHEVLQAK